MNTWSHIGVQGMKPTAEGGSVSPGTGTGLEKVGISGVCGVRPAWPLVMSCPAPTEKVDMGGPAGGDNMLVTERGGGVMDETKEGAAGELDGGNAGRLVKGASVEVGGNWEGVPRWPRNTEGGETGGTLGDTEGLWTGMGLDPWRDMGLDTPEREQHRTDFRI